MNKEQGKYLTILSIVLLSFVLISCGPVANNIGRLVSKSLSKSTTSAPKTLSKSLSKSKTEKFHSIYEDIIQSNKSNHDINFMKNLDSKVLQMRPVLVQNYKEAWILLSESSPEYVQKLHSELNDSLFGSFEKPRELLEQLSKVELVLVASIFGATFSSEDSDAKDGGIINSERLAFSESQIIALQCRQTFDIISLRADITYSQFLNNLDNEKLKEKKCPSNLPNLSELEKYFVSIPRS